MESGVNVASWRPTRTATTLPLSIGFLPSPKLSQFTPRFAGERLSPTAFSNRDNTRSSSSQRSYFDGSDYHPQAVPLEQQQDARVQRRQLDDEDKRARLVQKEYHLTTAAGVSATHATPAASYTSATAPSTTKTPSPNPSANCQQLVGQMSVSLNQQASSGGQTSLGHYDSFTNSPSLTRSPLGDQGTHLARPRSQTSHAYHWSPTRSIYTGGAESYNSRNSQSPTLHNNISAHQGSSSYHSTMASNGGDGGGGDGFGRPPSQHHQQHQQQQQQHHQQSHGLQGPSLHGSLLTQHHSAPSQHHESIPRQDSGGSLDTSNSTASLLGYRSQHSQSMPSLSGGSGYPPKLGTVPTLPSQSSFQVFHQQPLHHQQHTDHTQQHTLPSATQPSGGMRTLIPPPLPSQAGMSVLSPSLGSYPAPNRGYASYHQPPHQPSAGSMAGPVISNIGNPNGQLAIVSGVGMPYGAGAGADAGRRPLLYSHGHMHPHLNPNQFGHHLPGIGGKGPQSPHERPFKCDQCPQSFNRNHDLKRHKRIHLAVKPFPCNYCDKSFSRKDALKRHRLVKGCGEKVANSDITTPTTSTSSNPPGGSGSVLSDTASDSANDPHSLH